MDRPTPDDDVSFHTVLTERLTSLPAQQGLDHRHHLPKAQPPPPLLPAVAAAAAAAAVHFHDFSPPAPLPRASRAIASLAAAALGLVDSAVAR
mmetsp:Transcript_1271/g.3992  ORF Transcript_1271/g.3992 Transcript_1271/m.3992 type:complete len:93 (+) Transcript_1271:1385-1663(+)